MNDRDNISGLIHHLSRQLNSASNRKWAEIGYSDIRTTHVSILIRIENSQMNHNALARQLGITRQGLSKLKHELIESGYLLTGPDSNNKKAETLMLTSKGQQFMRDFRTANASLEKAFIKVLGKEEFKAFRSSLLKLDNFFKQQMNE